MAVETGAGRRGVLAEAVVAGARGGSAPDQSESQISGIFDKEHVEVDVDAGVAVSSRGPQLRCREVDVAQVVQGYQVRVAGTVYDVIDVQHDGTGTSRLVLHEARID